MGAGQTYIANYYDAAGRLTQTIQYGVTAPTLGEDGLPILEPRVAADGDDDYLRTDYTYDAAGRLASETDARGIMMERVYDALGRVKTEILAPVPNMSSPDTNRKTTFEYNGTDQITRRINFFVNGSGSTVQRETTFHYYDSGPQSGLLWLVRHPGWQLTAEPFQQRAYQDSYTYNDLGEVITFIDHNGPMHSYEYDGLGQRVKDTVSFAAEQQIHSYSKARSYQYDVLGRLTTASALIYQGPGVHNQIKRQYNGFGQVTAEYQSNTGSVGAGTLAVRYVYEMDEGASRLRRMVYPTTDAQFAAGQGRSLWYSYDSLGRVSVISDVADSAAQALESYEYLGLGTPISQSRPLQDNPVQTLSQSFISGATYSRIDNFGRPVEFQWTTGGQGQQHLKYWYDANSNLLTRQDMGLPALSELYHPSGGGADFAYDKLNRIKAFDRGTLTGVSASGRPNSMALPDTQSWGTNSEGNRKRNYAEDTANPVDWPDLRPTFQGSFNDDDSGLYSMEQRLEDWWEAKEANDEDIPISHRPDRSLSVKFDPWGNLFELNEWAMDWGSVTESVSSTHRRTFRYDALDRRISEWQPDGTPNGTQTWFYTDLVGNVLEERHGSAHTSQYVWSPVTGQLVLRDRDQDNSSATTAAYLPAGNDERLWVLYDGQGNVSAIIDAAGQAVERYFYTPEGKMLVKTGAWGDLSQPDPNDLRRSAYDWRYTFQGGRIDGGRITLENGETTVEGIYYTKGGEWDYLTGGPLVHDAANYWNETLSYTSPALSLYDQAVLTTVPVALGVVVGFATGGLGFAAAGLFGGAAGGFSGGFASTYAAGGSVGESLQSGAVGGAIGGMAGFAGGAIVGRVAGGALPTAANRAYASGGAQGFVGRLGRFFYDPRSFRAISREYWAGAANGRSLHHWLIPQRWTRVPIGIRNAGFNLLELPSLRGVFHPTLSLNTWMGFATRWGGAHALKAGAVEWGIRIAIPGGIGGGAYTGLQLGEYLSNEER